MDETGKEGPHLGFDEQCAPQMKQRNFLIAVRLADMPDEIGKLLDMGLEDHFHDSKNNHL